MSVAPRLDIDLRVRFDECGADGRMRDSGLLRYAQEMAWLHSEAAGFGRHWYLERSLAWVVRGVAMALSAPIEHGATLGVSTQVTGWRRVWARRRSEFRDRAGSLVAEADIDWVLLGPKGTPVRIPQDIETVFTTLDVEVATTIAPTRAEVSSDEQPDAARVVEVRRRDLDPMAHVNNAVYLDDAEEAIVSAGGAEAFDAFPRRWRMEFLKPVGLDERLTGEARRTDHGWGYRLVDADGSDSFRALLNVES